MIAFGSSLTKEWASVALLAIPLLAGYAGAAPNAAAPPLQLQSIADVPLGGHPTRLDYASLDAGRHLLFIAHLGDSVATVQIDGEIGNTQYDDSSHHMFVSAQSTNQLVEVDPKTDMIVRRIPVPGAKENHGLLIDSAAHRAFVACQGNDQLIVIDLRTGAAIEQFPVAKGPTYWPSMRGS